MEFKLFLESFDSAVEFTPTNKGNNYQEYEFFLDDRKFTVEFVSKYNKDDYELVFYDQDGNLEKTNKGKSFTVFATVFDILKTFLKSHKPKIVRFSAKSDRERLYDILSKKVAQELNMELTLDKNNNEKEYILTNKEES